EKADLSARVTGVVESLCLDPSKPEVDIGRQVAAGEPLIKLAVPELEAERDNKLSLLEQAKSLRLQAEKALRVAAQHLQEAKVQVTRYQADLEFRQLQFQRVSELAKKQSVQAQLAEESELQLKSAQAALKAAQAQVQTKEAKREAAQAELKVADSRIKVAEAEVQRLNVQLNFATLTAPFAGVVTKRWVDRGATVKDPSVPR